MGEGLREVPECVASCGVDLFGEQPHVVGEGAQPFEGFLGVLDRSAAEGEVLRAPEAADAEGALAGRIFAPVAVKEAAASSQVVADPGVGLAHPFGRRLLETVPGKQQKAGVETIPVEPRSVAAQIGVPGARLHLPADRIAILGKLRRRRAGQVTFPMKFEESVQRRPAKHA